MRPIKFRAWDGERMLYMKDGVNMSHFFNKVHELEFLYDKKITLMQFTGLYDKNGREIYYNGQLLRIKGKMGDSEQYSFDSVFVTNEISFKGLSLSFVKLFDSKEQSVNNSIPMSQHPSFDNGALGWYDNYKLMLNDTYGENRIFKRRWQEHHKTIDIEVIGNIHEGGQK